MKICPSCLCRIDNSEAVQCPGCGQQLNNALPEANQIIGGLSRPKQPLTIDLAVTLDRTDSSRQFQDGIPKTLELVVRGIEQRVTDFRIFLCSHGDLDEGQTTILHTDGGSSDQAIEDIKQIQFQGGGDVKEHHLDAIEYLMNTIPWKALPGRSRSAILGIMTADTKPAKSGLSAAELGQQIYQRGISLYMVCEPTPTLYELARAAKGLIFPISVAPNPAELEIIAAQLTASITQPAGTGNTVPLA